MQFDPMEMARARLALHYAVCNNLFDRTRKVNLIDIARYEKNGQVSDKPAIRFHVDEKIPDTHLEAMGREPLQRQPILDIPTMVVKGKYHLHQWSWWGRRPDPHLAG